MSEFETVEQKQLIAKRVPPGDRWVLVDEPSVVHSTLTETLEAYFKKTQFNAAFYFSGFESGKYIGGAVMVFS